MLSSPWFYWFYCISITSSEDGAGDGGLSFSEGGISAGAEKVSFEYSVRLSGGVFLSAGLTVITVGLEL